MSRHHQSHHRCQIRPKNHLKNRRVMNEWSIGYSPGRAREPLDL
jgi:hypothetical protein